jgi:LPXTG-motif cell wall-anchored protein
MEDAIEIAATEYASSTTTLTLYKDADGNLSDTVTTTTTTVTFDVAAVAKNIINYTGTELPSTGGMGTTLFYIAGGLLVLVAGILLITKKRMKSEM